MKNEFVEAYLRSGGTFCPYCKGTAIQGGAVDIDNGIALQGMSCLDCDKSWTDVYRLVNIKEET